MRIIGIKIIGGDSSVIKNLESNHWYPFGDYPEPVNREGTWVIEPCLKDIDLYQMFRDIPTVSICGIVGKNGSGKSTVIDCLLMILNNAACYLLNDQYGEDEVKPRLSHGLHGELFFESHDTIMRIKCDDTNVYFSEGGPDEQLTLNNTHDRYNIIADLCYVIFVNYGIYGLNENDYQGNNPDGEISGKWLKQLYNIEQNYIFPITITPLRRNGNIDINEHLREAMEKLVALMMYSKINNNDFLDGYYPITIHYQLDEGVESFLADKIAGEVRADEVKTEWLMHIKTAILNGWANYLGCEGLYVIETNDVLGKQKEIYNLLLDYIASYTLLLCIHYVKFRNIFNVVNEAIWLESNGSIPEGWEDGLNSLPILFGYILSDETTVTYGIKRCVETIKCANKGLDTPSYLKYEGTIAASEFKIGHSLKEIIFRLPPPIFKLDLALRKNSQKNKRRSFKMSDSDGIMFSKLSSGEKQWMLSLSSAMFHIKNIEESVSRLKGFGYKNVCLIFDEAELYFHPDFQRGFVYHLLQYLSWLGLVKGGFIESIQIIIATHSPFILSDLAQNQILFMKDGCDYRASLKDNEREVFRKKGTFGANYYELLRSGFFLEDNSIGLFASDIIGKLVTAYHSEHNKKRKKFFMDYHRQYIAITEIIADKYLQQVVKSMIADMALDYKEQ